MVAPTYAIRQECNFLTVRTGKSGGADKDLVLAKAVKMQDNREAGRLAAARRIQGKKKEKLHEQYKRPL
jgi:phage anti-repressor protein